MISQRASPCRAVRPISSKLSYVNVPCESCVHMGLLPQRHHDGGKGERQQFENRQAEGYGTLGSQVKRTPNNRELKKCSRDSGRFGRGDLAVEIWPPSHKLGGEMGEASRDT